MRGKLFLASAALMWAGSAMAVIAPVASCTVNSVTPGPLGVCFFWDPLPLFAGGDAFGNNNLQVWVEQKNYTLTSALTVDWIPMLGSNPIPVGTKIASVGIEFDPVKERTMDAEITFTRKILGIIWSRNTLVASDYLAPTITFSSPLRRGLEPGDIANTWISSDGLTFKWTTSRPGDNIRVILSAVPEPATWAMLIAGFGMVGFAARRRRATPLAA